MLPGPRIAYNPYKNLAKVLKRSDMILRLLRGKGVLSEDEYRTALAEVPNIGGMQTKVDSSIKKEEALTTLSSASVQARPAGDSVGAGTTEPAPSSAGTSEMSPATKRW